MHAFRAKIGPFLYKSPIRRHYVTRANSYTLLKMMSLSRESVATEVHAQVASFHVYQSYRTGVNKISPDMKHAGSSTRGTVLMLLRHSQLRPFPLVLHPRIKFSVCGMPRHVDRFN